MKPPPSARRPDCFGDLETVFPMGPDGFRESPPGCMQCPHKTDCLRAAVTGKKGETVRREAIDRAYRSGTIGFLERWSRRKMLKQGAKAQRHKGTEGRQR